MWPSVLSHTFIFYYFDVDVVVVNNFTQIVVFMMSGGKRLMGVFIYSGLSIGDAKNNLSSQQIITWLQNSSQICCC